MTKLDRALLVELGANCTVPKRDISSQRVSIIHLGPGAFHRARQALATKIGRASGADDWAICSVSMRSAIFAKQNGAAGRPLQPRRAVRSWRSCAGLLAHWRIP